MISAEDRARLDAFAKRVRVVEPAAAIWARARGPAHPDSDLDLCMVVPEVTRVSARRRAASNVLGRRGATLGLCAIGRSIRLRRR